MSTATLESYLRTTLDVDSVDISVLHEGLNAMYTISTPDQSTAYVLRHPNKLRDTEAFNDLQTEYAILQHLEHSPIPVPEPITYCDDPAVYEEPFFVTTALDGTTIQFGDDLTPRFQTQDARQTLATSILDTLTDLHTLDTTPFRDLCTQYTPREQVARAQNRLDTIQPQTGRDYTRFHDIGDWLLTHEPTDTISRFVHGDYRPGNILFTGDTHPRLTGVIDWETAFIGDPRTELGYLLLLWGTYDTTPIYETLKQRYGATPTVNAVHTYQESGIHPFSTEPGSPSRTELRNWYTTQTNITVQDPLYFQVHAALMLATVWEDLHRTYVETAADSNFPPRIEYITHLAEHLIDRYNT